MYQAFISIDNIVVVVEKHNEPIGSILRSSRNFSDLFG
jgi:hypothetical protein